MFISFVNGNISDNKKNEMKKKTTSFNIEKIEISMLRDCAIFNSIKAQNVQLRLFRDEK
jgi:hypothetical protein